MRDGDRRHFSLPPDQFGSPAVRGRPEGGNMASDISLAVGDGARRMTYAELADIRRISVLSAMRLVRRKNWPRQTGNDGVVRVLVPLHAAADRKQRKDLLRGTNSADKPNIRRGQVQTSDRTSAPDKERTIAALESAIAALREQLARSQARADRLQDELSIERRRVIEILVDRRPWWRRWLR
jgi:hypothetical protein